MKVFQRGVKALQMSSQPTVLGARKPHLLLDLVKPLITTLKASEPSPSVSTRRLRILDERVVRAEVGRNYVPGCSGSSR